MRSVVTFTDIEECVEHFHKSFPRPGVPNLPTLLTPQIPFVYGETWAKLWAQGGILRKFAECACVYFFFNDVGELRYIGSTRNLGKRFFQHFDTKDAVWKSRTSSLAVLPLPEDNWFEASAIESYLIENLDPPDNTVGKRHV